MTTSTAGATKGGKTILVTGATDGIGKETARALAVLGHDVLVHGRTLDKAQATCRELAGKLANGGRLRAVHADLASLDEVRALATVVRAAAGGHIDALVNNAGIYAKTRKLTADGRELTIAVNHDAPFLLTHLLLDALEPRGRIVNVSSIAHSRGRINVDDIDLDMAPGFDGYSAYASSKLANVLFTVELARRLAARGSKVTVNALHPGVVSTKLLRAGFNMNGPDSTEDGAATSIFLATGELDVSGKYFVRSLEATPHPAAQDASLCAEFYEASCRRVGIAPL